MDSVDDGCRAGRSVYLPGTTPLLGDAPAAPPLRAEHAGTTPWTHAWEAACFFASRAGTKLHRARYIDMERALGKSQGSTSGTAGGDAADLSGREVPTRGARRELAELGSRISLRAERTQTPRWTPDTTYLYTTSTARDVNARRRMGVRLVLGRRNRRF
jgi:hypothetical protein